ncbi:MAG: DUF2071 domain-containing protein, partial [Saprospiraceae bacterium]
RHQWSADAQERTTQYEWEKAGQWHSFSVTSELETQAIAPNSETEFITEHYWGYTKVNDKTTYEYEVQHPKWEVYPIKSYEIDVDFGAVYGEDFAHLNQLTPSSVLLAEGSAISVENKRKI